VVVIGYTDWLYNDWTLNGFKPLFWYHEQGKQPKKKEQENKTVNEEIIVHLNFINIQNFGYILAAFPLGKALFRVGLDRRYDNMPHRHPKGRSHGNMP